MKSRFILCSIIAILAVCFVSCTQDELPVYNHEGLFDNQQVGLYSDNDEPLLPFAKALYSAMKESPALRKMIKSEAQEKFNKEYETLYQFIKNERVENGLSVRELLLKYFENEESLSTIEAKHPTLTIHIPILPKGSFSADIWKANEQIPAVAIHPTKGVNVTLVADKGQYGNKSDEFVIEAGFSPAFPVVVLKDNNRVVVSQNASSRYSSLNNRSSDYVFDFIDDYFDGSIEEKESEISLRQFSFTDNLIDSKVIAAYGHFPPSSGWQRDYIFYNLTPQNPTNGTISLEYKETLRAFTLQNSYKSPQDMLTYIAHPNTTIGPQFQNNGLWPWTAGSFDFRITAIMATRNASPSIPNTIIKTFAAYPDELFVVTQTLQGNTYKNTVTGYGIKLTNIDLFNWNLNNYAEAMSISIWKINPDYTENVLISFNTKFINNVTTNKKNNVEYTFGTTTTTTTSVTAQKHFKDIHLGTDIVMFSHPVITGSHVTGGKTYYSLREYDLGFCKFYLSPQNL